MDKIRYRALLVGNGTFPEDPHNLLPLNGPRNDLRLLEEILAHKQVGLHDAKDIKSILDCTREEVMTAVEDFFDSAKSNEQLLFYYSGHGRLDKFNKLYFCTRDTNTKNLLSTSVPASLVSTIIDNSASIRTLIVLDCCHSGRFKGGDLPAEFLGEGRFVLTSCRARALASDTAEDDGPSPFTRYVAEAILSGEVDADRNGYVSVNEIYDYVLPRLRDAEKQVPQRRVDEAIGDLTVARSIVQPVKPRKKTDGKPTGKPILNVSETSISITDVMLGEDLPEETIDVFNEGDGDLDWTAESNDDWIEIEAHKGYFTFKMHPKPGSNRGRIYVRDKGRGGSKRIQIFVQVHEAELEPVLELSADRVDFGTVSQSTEVPRETLRLINAGGGDLKAELVPQDDPNFHVELQEDILTVTPETSRIGSHHTEITIKSAGGNKTISVRVNVEAGPVLAVHPTKVDFGEVEVGDNAAITLKVANAGRGHLEYTYKVNADFFEVEKAPNAKPKGSVLLITLDATEPGKYRGTLVVNSNGGDATIDVRAKVAGIAASPPEPAGVPLEGNWALPDGQGMLVFSRVGGQYQYAEINMLGIQLGQGVAHVQGDRVTLQGANMIAGPVAGQFEKRGPLLVGQITAAGMVLPASLTKM